LATWALEAGAFIRSATWAFRVGSFPLGHLGDAAGTTCTSEGLLPAGP